MDAWRVDNVEIAALSVNDWRVSEPDAEGGGIRSVLGIVHRVDDDYEVHGTGEQRATILGSLVSAIDYLAAHGAAENPVAR
ncbi:MAG: hypothetical protein ABWX76_00480 [Leifsonia flava]